MKWKYIAKRLLIAIPTFLGITVLAYFILNLAPGSPLDALLADPKISPAELERKRIALGLDKPKGNPFSFQFRRRYLGIRKKCVQR